MSTKKYKEMAELYKIFASDWKECLDFSDEALEDMYNSESFGAVKTKSNNGYAVGKKWLSVNVSMWKEDIHRGHLPRQELYSDSKFPKWWLDKVL